MKSLSLAAALLFSLCAPAFAGVTYSTGQDANADGRDDAFTVNGSAAFLVKKPAFDWPLLPNGAATVGRYISWDANQFGRPSSFKRDASYNFGFDFVWNSAVTPVGGTELATIDFKWISDDHLLDVILNGQSLGVNNIGKTLVWTKTNTASVSALVASGQNSIQFLTKNTGGGAVGLAADFTITGPSPEVVDVPEPAPLALLGLGLVALAARRKGRA